MRKRKYTFRSRMASKRNGRKFLRRASRKSAIKRRNKSEYTFTYEREPFFNSTEEFFNFLFGTITVVIIFISIFKFAPEMLDPHGVIDIRDIMNNNTNKTENVRVINRRKINTTNTPNSPF